MTIFFFFFVILPQKHEAAWLDLVGPTIAQAGLAVLAPSSPRHFRLSSLRWTWIRLGITVPLQTPTKHETLKT